MRIISKAAINQWSVIRIIDATDGTPETGVTAATPGLVLEYCRTGSVPVAISVSDDANPVSHEDGGLYNMGHGNYMLGVPDAAFATGSGATNAVTIQGTATGMIVIGETIQMSAFEMQTDLTAATINTAVEAGQVGTNAAALAADWADAGRLDTILDDNFASVTAVQTIVSGHTTDIVDILTDTADMQPKIGTPATDLATDIAGVSASAVPVSQVPVPDSRTFDLVRSTAGLVGEQRKSIQVGEAKTFAVDFHSDLPTNGRLSAFDSIAIQTGTAGGVTFDTANKGVDKTQAKIEITGVTAGTYVLRVTVTYNDASGGGTTAADVTLVVVD